MSYLIPGRRMRTWFQQEKLFDYGAKFATLREIYPRMPWNKMRLAKGGGSLAFIVNDTVFKVRKHNNEPDTVAKFTREKRITDAIRPILPIAVPNIELISANKYIFYKSNLIHGRVLVDMPLKRIRENNEKIGKQIGTIIYTLFNAKLTELDDLRPNNTSDDKTGMVHGDMCSNIIVNPKTMDVVGIIDWEYANFSPLEREFIGIFRVRRKMRMTDIAPIAMIEYYKLRDKKRTK